MSPNVDKQSDQYGSKQQRQRKQLSLTAMSLVLGLLLVWSIALFDSSPSSAEENRVTICHRTGSPSNSYVVITVDENALPAHLDHGDVYPVPPNGCPAGVPPTTTPTMIPSNTPTNAPTSTSTPTEPPDPGPDGMVLSPRWSGNNSFQAPTA
jgi:hypothetical protein